MTLQEAQAKAKQLWGDRGIAVQRDRFYLVGTESDYGSKNDATGLSSFSFEEAFKYAEEPRAD